MISIHALREEGDPVTASVFYGIAEFLSTPSARRATRGSMNNFDEPVKFLSTPSARRATNSAGDDRLLSRISIHALREEGDL